MDNSTKIIIVRHGQSIGNQTKTFLGHTDLDLSELGYLQADATAKALKDYKIDKIYSSDLKRAYNTAVPNAKLHNLEIKTSKNLREAYVGKWEGMFVGDIIEKWGREVFVDQWANNFGNFAFPGGESIISAGMRFYNEVLAISNENSGKTILICAHAAVIRSFWAIISDISADDIVSQLSFPTNASYSLCECKNGQILPISYSNDDHLSEVGITKVNLI